MSFINKKGVLFSSIVTITIISISFLLLLSIVYQVNKKVSTQNVVKQCQLSSSVEGMSSKLLAYVDGGDSSFTTSCPRFSLDVNKDYIVLNNLKLNKPKRIDTIGKLNKETQSYIYSTKDTEKVYRAVSNEIALCWEKFNRGTTDVFDFEYSSKNADRSLCFICNEVNINVDLPKLDLPEKRVFNKNSKQYSPNFHNYFVQSIYKKDLTYLDYMNNVDINSKSPFANARDTFIDEQAPTPYDTFFTKGVSKLERGGRFYWSKDKIVLSNYVDPIDILNPSSTYYIIFRKPSLHKNTEKDYFSYIIPSTKLNNYCDVVI